MSSTENTQHSSNRNNQVDGRRPYHTTPSPIRDPDRDIFKLGNNNTVNIVENYEETEYAPMQGQHRDNSCGNFVYMVTVLHVL